MDPLLLIGVLIFAFVSEYVHSSMGMGYGTLLTPLLLILGFGTHEAIHAVLLSQGLVNIIAAYYHWRLGNLNLGRGSEDARIMAAMAPLVLVLVPIGAYASVRLPPTALDASVALVVVLMGMLLLVRRRFRFSWASLLGCGVVSVLAKGLTGAGFGPVFTAGQVMSGKGSRSAIGVSVALTVPVCLVAFASHYALMASIDWWLTAALIAGALAAVPFGPRQTATFRDVSGRIGVGVLTIVIGTFMLVKEFAWPSVMGFMLNPFFWALVAMFGLIGSSATIVSRTLARHQQLNIAMVATFTLGRALLVLPLCDQPCFSLGGWEYAIGGALFALGVGFLAAILSINPFPGPDDTIQLCTTGHYAIVRNPMYLGELLWCLGWSVMWGSVIGVALVPLWWAGLMFHIILEEEDLERRLGRTYLEYKSRVRGRLIPGLPV